MVDAQSQEAPFPGELNIGRLYEVHASFLARSIERLSGPGAHVDDLLQESFVVAFRKRREFDPCRAEVRTWLYGIAANLCRRHRRSRFRLANLLARFQRDLEERPSPVRPDQQLERMQRLHIAQRLLAKLPFKQREVFSLYELENLDGPAIAAMLQIPVGTVWTRLHHARARFTKLTRTCQGKGDPA